MKQINDDHQYPDDPFVALADFEVILERDGKRTVHERLRKTPSSPRAKFLTNTTEFTSVQKQALVYADALLRSVGTCQKML